jgi:hypothetical protein
VVFRRERDGARRVMSLDEMLTHLDAWDRTADRRMAERRIAALARREIERRALADRRARHVAAEHRRREMDQDSPSLIPVASKNVPDIEAPPAGAPRLARESEVPVPRSSEARTDRAPRIGRPRDGSDSVMRPPSRHSH